MSFNDRGRFVLEGEIVRASVKSIKYIGDDLVTQANAHDVVSNTRGCSMCHDDGATKNKNVVHK